MQLHPVSSLGLGASAPLSLQGGPDEQRAQELHLARPAIPCSAVRRGALIAPAACVRLAACGNGSGSQAQSSPVVTQRQPEPDREPRRRGVRLRRSGTSTSRSTSPRRRATATRAVRRRAGRHDPGRHATASSSARRSSTSRDRSPSGGEQGLLSMAFAPDYAPAGCSTSTTPTPTATSASSSTSARARTRADPGSARLRAAAWPTRSPTTTAACCCSGPTSCSTSASATAAAAATSTARAATPRTSARCSARSCASTREPSGGRAVHDPADNPFVGRAGARGEIYSYGLRNPWRFSFDRTTGDLTIGDVGQDAVEEIDFVRRGQGPGRELRLARVRGPRALHARRVARRARSSR